VTLWNEWINLAHDMEQWVGFCEHGNEPHGFINCGKYLDQLSDCQLLNDSAPCSYSSCFVMFICNNVIKGSLLVINGIWFTPRVETILSSETGCHVGGISWSSSVPPD